MTPVNDLEEKLANLDRITAKALEALDQLRDQVAALTIINAIALAKLEAEGALDLSNVREAAASNLTTLGDDARRLDQIALHIEKIIGKARHPAILTVIHGGKEEKRPR